MDGIDNDSQPQATDKNRPKKYIILKSLGKGSFGRVKEALHVLSGEKIAIKILEKSRIKKEDDLKRIRREMNILAKVNHPSIIQLYETIETYKYFFFVMEYAKTGELSDYIEKRDKLSEKESCKLFQQLISSVEYLHKLGCAHRDIKPSNIQLDEENDLKLIDFGLGNLYSNGEKLNTACGSPCYAAPEIISGQDYDPIQVDIWSSGITLYCMTVGCLPFDEETKTELYQKIQSCSYSLPKWMSGECADLIKRILVRDPKQRLDLNAIKRHPWFGLYQPVQLSPGVIVGYHEIKINRLVCRLAAQMQNIEYKTLREMLAENDHNKYTTLYFLLIKKETKYENIAKEKGLDALEPFEKEALDKKKSASRDRTDISRKNSKISVHVKDEKRNGSTDRYENPNDSKVIAQNNPMSEGTRREITNRTLEKRKKVMDNIIEKQRQSSVDGHCKTEDHRPTTDYHHSRNRSNDITGENSIYQKVMKSIDRSLERHDTNTPKIPKLEPRTPPLSVERRNMVNNSKVNELKDICVNQISLNETTKNKLNDTVHLNTEDDYRKNLDRTPKAYANKSNSIDPNKSRLSQSRIQTSGNYYDPRKSNKNNKKIIEDLKRKVYDKKIDGKVLNQTMMEQTQARPTSRDLSKVIDSNLTTDRERKKLNHYLITQKISNDNSKNQLQSVLKRTTTPVHKNPMLQFNNSIDSKGLVVSPQTNHNNSHIMTGISSKRNSSKIYKRDGSLTINLENPRLPNSQRDRSSSNNKNDDIQCPDVRKIKYANNKDPTQLTAHSTRLENSCISKNAKDLILDKLMPKLQRNNSKVYPNLDDEMTHTEPVRTGSKDPLLNHVITTKTTTKTEIYHTYNVNHKANKKEPKNYTDRFANEKISRNNSDHSFTDQNKRDANLSAENRYYDRNQTSNNRINGNCSSKNSQKRHKNNVVNTNFNLIYMNNPKVNVAKRNSINLNKTQNQPNLSNQENQQQPSKEEMYATTSSRPISKKKNKSDYNYADLKDQERLSKTPGALTYALKNIVKKKTDVLKENNFSIDLSKNKSILKDNNSIYRTTDQGNNRRQDASYQIYKAEKLGGSIDRKRVTQLNTKGISNNFSMNYPLTVDDREMIPKENLDMGKPPDSHEFRGERRAEKRRSSKTNKNANKKYNVCNENEDMIYKSTYYD